MAVAEEEVVGVVSPEEDDLLGASPEDDPQGAMVGEWPTARHLIWGELGRDQVPIRAISIALPPTRTSIERMSEIRTSIERIWEILTISIAITISRT